MKVDPWHSVRTPGVYHDNTDCTEGNNIEVENRVAGKGQNRIRCELCVELELGERYDRMQQ